MTVNICMVIPVYNHAQFLASTLASLAIYQLPAIVVDDGSEQESADILAKIKNIHLVTLPTNQGKGAAVIAGMREAARRGFTHVLQIDADGQHNAEDVTKFISACQKHPEALIAGRPIFDDSIPKSRLYGRYVTHVWVWIETLSLQIKDSMCGFRIYPLASSLAVADRQYLGKRMDFDTEIMVRLFWQAVPLVEIDTKVIYPEQGVSHFKIWRDNLLISWMHTRLFFGMLYRLPLLLWRKWRRA